MSFSNSEKDVDLSKWKVADLKKELKLRGLSSDGKKNDLIVRLQVALGGSNLLDETVHDQDELLDEDVLMDEEVDTLEDPDLKSDTLENLPERRQETAELKRKSDDNENKVQPAKKIILKRNFLSVSKNLGVTEGKKNKTSTESKDSEKINIAKVGSLTLQERLERRAAKFGVPVSNEAKKQARAARFGLTSAASKAGRSSEINLDVFRKRAERFGATLPGSILEKVEMEERKKKRLERFGKVDPMPPALKMKTTVTDQKKLLRAERFKPKS